MMKKALLYFLSAGLLMSSCGSYEASGAYTGSMFGSMIGSAIGGISGGPHGSDVGQLAGMMGGAMVGAAIGKAADSRQRKRYEVEEQRPAAQLVSTAPLEIRHVMVMDSDRDGVLTRGEQGRVVFEIYNRSSEPVYDVNPSVTVIEGNKHLHVSQNVLIEQIQPRSGVRYTASMKADNRLPDGNALIRVAVYQGGREVRSQTQDFNVPTRRR